MNICKDTLRRTSGQIASERVKLTVASDRLCCSGDEMQQMRKELADILKKYIIVNECVSEIQLRIVYEIDRGKQDVKTIQIK